MTLSEKLGFYFVVFQLDLNGYVKCWIDGSEDWTYYTQEDFLDLVRQSENGYNLEFRVKDAYQTCSIFMWDVENQVIKKLNYNNQDPYEVNIKDKIFPKNNSSSGQYKVLIPNTANFKIN